VSWLCSVSSMLNKQKQSTHRSEMPSSKTAFFLIPGAFCPGRYFDKLESALGSHEYHTKALERPTSDQSLKRERQMPGLRQDGEHVRQCIRDFWNSPGNNDTDVILVASSYGGAVAYEACEGLPSEKNSEGSTDGHGIVRHLILLGSLPADAGLTVAEVLGGQLPFDPSLLDSGEFMWIDPPPAEIVGSMLFASLLKDQQDHYLGMMVEMSPNAFIQKLSFAAWQSIPSTFVMGDQDKAVPPEMAYEKFDKALPKASVPLRKVVIHGGDHLTMLTNVEEVVKICLEVAT
jgi:pimeloyl-ACP methyl ester carboxylesterase